MGCMEGGRTPWLGNLGSLRESLQLHVLPGRHVVVRAQHRARPGAPKLPPKSGNILPIKGPWFQKLYLVWCLEPDSLNGQYMDP